MTLFGCNSCVRAPRSQEEFALAPVRLLFDGGQVKYTLYRCFQCDQWYLSHFREVLDFANGDDELWTHWYPLTEDQVNMIDIAIPDVVEIEDQFWLLEEFTQLRTALVYDPDGRYRWLDQQLDA